LCLTCGATLADVDIHGSIPTKGVELLGYDYGYGETDLLEADLHRVGRHYTMGIVVLLVAVMISGLTLMLSPIFLDQVNDGNPDSLPERTQTPRSTLSLPTVTTGPPTPWPTETEPPTATPLPTATNEPCYQTVLTGDGLYSIVSRCGHIHIDVFDLVIEINDLRDANSIIEGQILEIPWPTETPAPTVEQEEENDNSSGMTVDDEETVVSLNAFSDDFDPLYIPSSTPQPGIMSHTVQLGEDMITIGLRYGANAEILSQLNPEIEFSQCDFGQTFGGPRCTVFLGEGQRIRVPAPTATPTLRPTSSGSETPTPTATATFNAPNAQSPGNREFFRRDELITLRWVPSGTLGEGQTYRVRVEDATGGIVYIGDTLETFFVIPEEWRGDRELRHEYNWSVAVINIVSPDMPLFTTETLIFTWEGREEE
jgi:hypothetical protein